MSAIEFREGLGAMDFETVHRWLTSAYWSLGVSREHVERAAGYSSLVVGAFVGENQVGYTRLVSDRTRFAYLCDVFVAESHRGQGIARSMVAYCLKHPEHQGLRRWMLSTRDAHGVYARLGFGPMPHPDRWMIIEKMD